MALNDLGVREHAIATLHKLIESQSIHLTTSSLGIAETHESRAHDDIKYLDELFKGLVEIYRKAP